jgi:glycosyltransferase involved in cell wall biosynthesis
MPYEKSKLSMMNSWRPAGEPLLWSTILMSTVKPRVLITIDTYEIGGAGKVIIQFLKNGGKESCDPVVAGFWRGPEAAWQFRDAVESIGVPFKVLRQKSAYDPSVIPAALKIIRENNITILESHGYKAHIVCLALRHHAKLPWIAYVHGWTSENSKVELYNLVEKTVVRFADRIIPVSESLKSRLHLGVRAAEKAVVITNAADFVDTGQAFTNQRERFGVQENEILVGVIGRLSPEKGHRYFIDAMKGVAAKYGHVKAVFVGEGQERAALTDAISKNGLEGKVILAGFQQDVSSFYHACDIICLPSLSEGMPNVALEAMMFEKPVVAFSVGGIPEVVADGITGILVEPRNPVALAEAIINMIGGRYNLQEMGAAGRRRVEAEFNPRVRAGRVAEIHDAIL